MSRSTAVDALVACWAPKRAAERSHWAKPRLRRTMSSSSPTPTPPTMTIAPATVSARPVVACGSTRARSTCASRPWRRTSAWMVGGSTWGAATGACGQRQTSSVTRPPATTAATTSTITGHMAAPPRPRRADQPHVCPSERWVNVMVAMGISLSVAHDDADPGGASTASASSVRGARTDHTTDDHPTTGAIEHGRLPPTGLGRPRHPLGRAHEGPPVGGDRRRRVRRRLGGAGGEHHRHRAPADQGGAVRRPRPVGRVHQPLARRPPRRLLEPRDQRRHVHGQHAARGRAARAGRRRARAAAPLARGALPRRRAGLRAHGLPGRQRGRRPAAPERPPVGLDAVDEQLPLGPHRRHPRAVVRHGADRERHRPQPGGADRCVGRRRRGQPDRGVRPDVPGHAPPDRRRGRCPARRRCAGRLGLRRPGRDRGR